MQFLEHLKPWLIVEMKKWILKRLGQKGEDRIFFSSYLGRDIFRFDERQGFNWGNRTGTIRWNHLFNDRLFSNFTTIYSNYDYQLAFGSDDRNKFEWDSKIETLNLKPEFTYFIDSNNEFNKEKLGPTKAVYYATKEIWFVSKTTIQFVGSMFQGKADTSQLGGPIKIAKISGQVMEFGILAFLSTIAYISISLGLINLFPIPLLDGGHLMFYLFEKILGRPLSQATQEGFFRIGLFLLLSLMLFTTFSDLKDLGLF